MAEASPDKIVIGVVAIGWLSGRSTGVTGSPLAALLATVGGSPVTAALPSG